MPDDVQFSRRKLAMFVEWYRERIGGQRSPELAMLTAIAWCGAVAPIEELARKAAVSSPNALVDSLRKQARRVLDRLVARGVLVVREVRLPDGACSHTELQGKAGRADCIRQRRKRGRGETCVAHHGYAVRALTPGLTRLELVERLAIDDEEITRRVAASREAKEQARLDEGRQGNDAEGRKLAGLPTTRGPRGTNHTSPRRRALPAPTERPTLFVPPLPPEGEGEGLLKLPLQGLGGTTPLPAQERAPTALADCFAPPARVVECKWASESPPAGPAMGSGRADERGVQASCHEPTPALPATERSDEARELARPVQPEVSAPRDLTGGRAAKVAQIATARATRALVDWFCAAWLARQLPPLKRLESRSVVWARCKRFSRGELAIALRIASRRAPTDGEATFRRMFADTRVLAQLIDEERERPEATAARRSSGLVPLDARAPGGRRGDHAPPDRSDPAPAKRWADERARFAAFAGFHDIHEAAESEDP